VASTPKPAETDPASAAERRRAADAVGEADHILWQYTKPGRMPSRAEARRFVDEGHLERVLALYLRAMRDEPDETSYPWNLASSLDRLYLSDLALPFIGRAVRTARADGDEDFGGAAAHVAWAEVAMNADQPELASVLLEKARAMEPSISLEQYERRLRRLTAS
jgi:hypothetical protein